MGAAVPAELDFQQGVLRKPCQSTGAPGKFLSRPPSPPSAASGDPDRHAANVTEDPEAIGHHSAPKDFLYRHFAQRGGRGVDTGDCCRFPAVGTHFGRILKHAFHQTPAAAPGHVHSC